MVRFTDPPSAKEDDKLGEMGNGQNIVRFTDPDQAEEQQMVRFSDDEDDLIDDDEDAYDTESESEYVSEQQRLEALQMLQQHNENFQQPPQQK